MLLVSILGVSSESLQSFTPRTGDIIGGTTAAALMVVAAVSYSRAKKALLAAEKQQTRMLKMAEVTAQYPEDEAACSRAAANVARSSDTLQKAIENLRTAKRFAAGVAGAVVTAGVVRLALPGAGEQGSKKEAENPLTASLAKKDQELAAALRAHDSTRQELEALSLTHQNTQSGYSEIASRLAEAEKRADQTQRDKDKSAELSKQALDDLAAELAVAQAQMVSAQEEIDRLKRAHAGEVLLAQGECDVLKAERDALATELATLKERARMDGDGARAEMDRLAQELTDTTTQLDEARRNLAAKTTESNERMRALEAARATSARHLQDINDLQAEQARLVSNLTRTARQGADSEAVFSRARDALAAELAALKAQHDELIRRHSIEVGVFGQQVREKSNELQICKAQLAALQEEQRSALGAREQERADAERRVATLQRERDSAMEQARKTRGECDTLAGTLAEKAREIGTLTSEMVAVGSKLVAAEKEVSLSQTDRSRRYSVRNGLTQGLNAEDPDRRYTRDEVVAMLDKAYLV